MWDKDDFIMTCISVLGARCNEALKKLLGLQQENETTKKQNSELKRENARFVLFSYYNYYNYNDYYYYLFVCFLFFFWCLPSC